MQPSSRERVLVISHAHPDFSLGGGEIAAYNLFKAYKRSTSVEEATFLARLDRGGHSSGTLHLRREDEYVWDQGIADWRMTAANRDSTLTRFAELVRALRPTIVHAHHYVHLGLEYLRVIRQIDPSVRIFMTLHEYIAICANNGQMVKTNGQLCNRESIDDCQRCFPHKTSEDFWLRRHFIRRHFDLVDGFIAPSQFLMRRYGDWGLDPGKIVVIENGQPDAAPLAPRVLRGNETRNRFGFFGQINRFKGLDVLLSSLKSLPADDRRRIVLEVHGANLELQTGEYQEHIEALRRPLIEEGVVRWVGPYQPEELADRMRAVDWVVVPSVWWENSPMVIQEAFAFGRPLIVSNIGGMAEKVSDGVDGIHVPVGNHLAWAETLRRAADLRDEWSSMRASIVKPIGYDECARDHLSIFKSWSDR